MQAQNKMENNKSIAIADEACAFNFSDNQGKHYHKTEFVLHARVAELVGDILGRVFYHDDNATWSISAEELRDLALTNVLREDWRNATFYWESPIYGSAIAFEPGVWTQTDGLDKGVTYPASSMACRDDSSYCESNVNTSALQLTELNTNSDGMSLYSPYAFRGQNITSVYKECSRETPEYCPSMDVAFAYDYSNITTVAAEWYNVRHPANCIFVLSDRYHILLILFA